MKITIEPTDNKPMPVDQQTPAVSVQVEGDDLNVTETFEALVLPALRASGWSDDIIEIYLTSRYPRNND